MSNYNEYGVVSLHRAFFWAHLGLVVVCILAGSYIYYKGYKGWFMAMPALYCAACTWLNYREIKKVGVFLWKRK